MPLLPSSTRMTVVVALVGLAAAAGVAGWLWPGRTPGAVNVDASGVAIQGYDPVAYFTEGRPRQGSSEFEHVWDGARWRFASADHRDLFAANPDRYVPQYGGHCAAALAAGKVAGADPEAWTIVDGKLYLNFTVATRATWRQGAREKIGQADREWARLRPTLR